MLIFLDIDGVLHPGSGPPVDEHRRFTCLDTFVAALSGYENVEVVISSRWRGHHSVDELKSILGRDLGEKIVGVTPLGKNGAGRLWRREQEILAWLHYHDRQAEPWLAVDDAEEEFVEHRTRLIACDPAIGFCERNAEALRALMASN